MSLDRQVVHATERTSRTTLAVGITAVLSVLVVLIAWPQTPLDRPTRPSPIRTECVVPNPPEACGQISEELMQAPTLGDAVRTLRAWELAPYLPGIDRPEQVPVVPEAWGDLTPEEERVVQRASGSPGNVRHLPAVVNDRIYLPMSRGGRELVGSPEALVTDGAALRIEVIDDHSSRLVLGPDWLSAERRAVDQADVYADLLEDAWRVRIMDAQQAAYDGHKKAMDVYRLAKEGELTSHRIKWVLCLLLLLSAVPIARWAARQARVVDIVLTAHHLTIDDVSLPWNKISVLRWSKHGVSWVLDGNRRGRIDNLVLGQDALTTLSRQSRELRDAAWDGYRDEQAEQALWDLSRRQQQ